MITREHYKRLLKFTSSAVILFVEVTLYWFIWVDYLNTIIENPFFRKGNWLIAALYAALLLCKYLRRAEDRLLKKDQPHIL